MIIVTGKEWTGVHWWYLSPYTCH